MYLLKKMAVLVLSVSLLYGCGGTPAPTNDSASQDKISANIAAVIAKKGYKTPLSPENAVEVLNDGLEKTGYSYSATLKKTASDGVSVLNQAEYKAAFFMIMPAVLIAQQEKSKEESLELLAKIYSSSDFKSVTEIIRMMDEQSGQPLFRSKLEREADLEAENKERIRKRDEAVKKSRETPDQYSKYAH